MKRKDKRSLAIIYARYIFPLVSDLVFIILSFIPCIRYKLDSASRESISLAELIKNAWVSSRQYLFSAETQKSSDETLFCKVIFIALIVFALLFLLGLAVHIFSLSAFISSQNKSNTKQKNIYVAIIPNRVFLLCLESLSLPIVFFPELLTKLYRSILFYTVTLGYSLFPLWIVFVALFAINIFLTLFATRYEKHLELNIFAKPKIAYISDKVDEYEKDEETPTDEGKVYNLKQESINEQTERLRKLLGYSDNDSNETEK